MPRKYTPKEMLDELDRVAAELGRAPTVNEMNEQGDIPAKAYKTALGSWNEALKAAGYEPNLRHGIPKEDLLDELDQLADELGRAPKVDEMEEQGAFSANTYRDRFGSWNKALEASGLEPNRRRNIPRDDLLDEINRLADKVGGTPTVKEMDEHGSFAKMTYIRRFGSWNAALGAVGLEPNRRQNITRDELLTELQRLAEERGKTPSAYDMDEYGEFWQVTYKNRFGSWNEAVEAAGLEPNSVYGVRGDD